MTQNEKKLAALVNALSWALLTGEWDECNENDAKMWLTSNQLVREIMAGKHDGPRIITPSRMQ